MKWWEELLRVFLPQTDTSSLIMEKNIKQTPIKDNSPKYLTSVPEYCLIHQK